MATTAQYLKSLVNDKHNLVLTLQDRDIEANDSETFTELIPKLNTPATFVLSNKDAQYLFFNGSRSDDFDNLISRCENLTDVSYICYQNNKLTESQLNQLIELIKPTATILKYSFSGIATPLNVDLSDSNISGLYYAFYNATGLTYFKAPPKILQGGHIFEGYTALKKVDLSLCKGISDSYIGSGSYNNSRDFYGCINLEEVILPDNLEGPFRIDCIHGVDSTFYNCTSLKRIVNIERGFSVSSQQHSPNNIFYNCKSLYQDNGILDLSKSGFSAGTYAGDYETIGSLFYGCSSLKKIILGGLGIGSRTPGSVYRLFYNCSSLEEVVFTKNITGSLSAVKEQFSGCPNLKIIDAAAWTFTPDKLVHTFYYCNNLEKLDLSGMDFTDTTATIYNITGNSIPKTCEIILKNQASVDYFVNAGYTNAHIKEEVQDAT